MSYKSYIGYIVPIVLAKVHNLLPPAAMFEYQTWNPPVVARGRTHNIYGILWVNVAIMAVVSGFSGN